MSRRPGTQPSPGVAAAPASETPCSGNRAPAADPTRPRHTRCSTAPPCGGAAWPTAPRYLVRSTRPGFLPDCSTARTRPGPRPHFSQRPEPPGPHAARNHKEVCQIRLTRRHEKGPQSARRGRRADGTVRHRNCDTPTGRQEGTALQLIPETLRLLRRQAEIRDALRHSSANRVLGERDLFLIRRLLARRPAAVQAITLTAGDLHRPIESLRASDVEQRR